jgi:hypothetical protein
MEGQVHSRKGTGRDRKACRRPDNTYDEIRDGDPDLSIFPELFREECGGHFEIFHRF